MVSAPERITSAAKRLIDFVNKSPSPYHVVKQCRDKLLASGFRELNEKHDWKKEEIRKEGRYFVIRNYSTIFAFVVGGKFVPGNGFSIIGAHTDSPCLKVKPGSKREGSGCLSVGVECYGGGIWASWFDRDLKIAGRALVKTPEGLSHHLVHIDQPILCVPHLAIHLQRDMNDAFRLNKEKHLQPLLATTAMKNLSKSEVEDGSEKDKSSQAGKHHLLLVKAICEQISCNTEDLLDFDLCLADTQEAVIGGILNEFIFSPRLDNLFNVFTGLEALVDSLQNDSISNDPCIRMLACYDNEEVGSASAQGAGSELTSLVMKRILEGLESSDSFERTLANSYLISADQAHAVHPNYEEKHEANHKPQFHSGPVLKFNCCQKYATTALTASIIRVIAEKAGVPLQDVVVRNDSSCGSTIGPILSSKLGVRTVDIGGPTLSMHSIREMCCTSSVAQSVSLYKTFFERFSEIDNSIAFK